MISIKSNLVGTNLSDAIAITHKCMGTHTRCSPKARGERHKKALRASGCSDKNCFPRLPSYAAQVSIAKQLSYNVNVQP